MVHKNFIIIVAAGLLLGCVCGCSDGSRKLSAQLRWQRTLDQARLQAAAKSLQEGRLAYAERILNECAQCSDPASDFAEQVTQLRSRIRSERIRYAKADAQANPEEMTY
jgi:hypothetical protein